MNDVSLTIFSAIDNTKFVKFITEIQDKNIMISLYKASFGY